jgi:hypothetical protein
MSSTNKESDAVPICREPGYPDFTEARNGSDRWLTVQHPDQPSLQLGLFTPVTDAPRGDRARGAESTQEPVETRQRGRRLPGSFGQWMEMIEARR